MKTIIITTLVVATAIDIKLKWGLFRNERIRVAAHNLIGHPLMEICYIIGARRLGNWIHDELFTI
jgi:hypothetical protein